MRRVILQEFMSLDGLAAGREDRVDFVQASTKDDRAFGREQLEMMDLVDTILLGRVTYQMFAGYWPHVTQGDESLFAERMNAIPKIVFSRTLDRAPWGTWDDAIVNRSDPPAEVQKLKRQAGKDIVVWGSLSVAQSLIDEALIDEYRLIYCPVALGNGRRLFRNGTHPLELKLAKTTPLERGAVLLHYAPR
jgi:dihydrofolate reductase